jgi:7-cyano-7-deazaguanine synthase in queuosine biosynthesis
MELAAPFELFLELLFGYEEACGECESCRLRLKALLKGVLMILSYIK